MSGPDPISTRQLVANNLAFKLKHARWSARKAAAALNVSHAWVSRRVSGEVELSVTDLVRFAELLRVEPAQLLTGHNEPTTPSDHEPMTRREDRATLELHHAVTQKLIANPAPVLAVVFENIVRLRTQVNGPLAQTWLDQWVELTTTASIGTLIDTMLSSSQRSIDLRQVSPFLGVLDDTERLTAIERAQPTPNQGSGNAAEQPQAGHAQPDPQ